jgi:hypothetical protein
LPTNSPAWLYGQLSYKRDPEDDRPLKFVDTLESLTKQQVLQRFKKQDGLQSIILDKTLIRGPVADQLKRDELAKITYYQDGALMKPFSQLE